MAVPNNERVPMTSGFFGGADDLAKYLVGVGKQIQKSETEALNTLTEINGVQYYWDRYNQQYRPIKPIIPDDAPVADPYAFFTLDGMIEYIKTNTEGLIPEQPEMPLILHVVDHATVKLMSKPSEHHKCRHCIAKVDAHTPSIVFDDYMDVERFNTQLLSMFIDTPARAELFKVVKSMTKEQGLNTTDDGVSQVITVKQGVSMAANVTFQNPVPLAPMRTFTEIDQPESNFTLRVNEDAECALFEADGGAWKNEAVARIGEYLRNNLCGYNVVVIA